MFLNTPTFLEYVKKAEELEKTILDTERTKCFFPKIGGYSTDTPAAYKLFFHASDSCCGLGEFNLVGWNVYKEYLPELTREKVAYLEQRELTKICLAHVLKQIQGRGFLFYCSQKDTYYNSILKEFGFTLIAEFANIIHGGNICEMLGSHNARYSGHISNERMMEWPAGSSTRDASLAAPATT